MRVPIEVDAHVSTFFLRRPSVGKCVMFSVERREVLHFLGIQEVLYIRLAIPRNYLDRTRGSAMLCESILVASFIWPYCTGSPCVRLAFFQAKTSVGFSGNASI